MHNEVKDRSGPNRAKCFYPGKADFIGLKLSVAHRARHGCEKPISNPF